MLTKHIKLQYFRFVCVKHIVYPVYIVYILYIQLTNGNPIYSQDTGAYPSCSSTDGILHKAAIPLLSLIYSTARIPEPIPHSPPQMVSYTRQPFYEYVYSATYTVVLVVQSSAMQQSKTWHIHGAHFSFSLPLHESHAMAKKN